MTKKISEEELENDFLNDLDDDQFIESFTAKARRKNDDNFDEIYLNEEVKNVFLYPLTTLTGKNIDTGIRVAKEKTTILVTTPNKAITTRIYLEDARLKNNLDEFVDSSNPSEQLIKASETLNGVIDDNKIDIDIKDFFLITFEKITNDNFDTVKKYLVRNIEKNFENDNYSLTFVSIEDFSSIIKSKNIIIVNSEPILNKVKEIYVETPNGCLVGQIKPVDDNGRFPILQAKKGTEIFPKLVFPFQTQPILSLVDYWNSDQIIPLNEILDFIKSLEKKYDEPFSLAQFLKLGKPADKPITRVTEVEKMKYYAKLEVDNGYWSGVYPDEVWISKIEEVVREEEIRLNQSVLDRIVFSPYGTPKFLNKKYLGISQLEVTPKNIEVYDQAFQVLLNMVTESFWKDNEFDGATKIVRKNDQRIEEINDKDIFEKRQKYEGQDRYSVTTNNWISWKKVNQDIINDIKKVKRIESTMAMLSGILKSNYSINKGDNDDYKILLPYYFELQNPINNPDRKWVEYKNLVVKLKSEYFEFKNNEILIKNNIISENLVHKLEYNHFAFPEITKTVESSSIPSSMPLDQQLANGEYSKYQVKYFTDRKEDIEKIINDYGSGKMSFNILNNSLNIKNIGEFIFKHPSFISEIKISSFFGSGNWKINFIDEKNKNFGIIIDIFDIYESSKSYINLIL